MKERKPTSSKHGLYFNHAAKSLIIIINTIFKICTENRNWEILPTECGRDGGKEALEGEYELTKSCTQAAAFKKVIYPGHRKGKD